MIEQRTDAWYTARLGKATASRFADVMATIRSGEAASRKNYRAELVAERLTGKKYDELTGRNFQSFEMLWGIDNEPLARMYYGLLTRNPVEECGFFEHDTLSAGASPDGLVGDDGTIEIKCPNTATHIDTLHTKKVPTHYYPQVQGQLWITGRKWADFVSFDPRMPDNARIIIIRVPRDEVYIESLSAEVHRFLTEVDAECEFVINYGRGENDANKTGEAEGLPVRNTKNVVSEASDEVK